MHSLSELGSNVPAFLAKLWKLVDDPDTNDLISWSEEGTSFFIRDQAQFSRKLLPMYYKHNNMASFIRQLNMYGFHKIVSADAGSLRLDKDEMEFAHQCFLRGHPYLLEHIKRKVGKSQFLNNKILEEGQEGSSNGVMVKAEFMNKVLSEVKSMRGRQDSVENRLASMKQENEALWRELSLLRQKHIKQQNIVNKLIQFLVTFVQPSQRLSPKRRYPLMINNIAHPTEKVNGKVSNINLDLSKQGQLIVLPTSQNLTRSPCGTTIHELDGDTILPDSNPDTDLLSSSIPLNVSGLELTEVIDSDLEPEVLNADDEVLDCLASGNISSVPLLTDAEPTPYPLEVNSSEQTLLDAGDLNMDSPSPEALLTVCPSDLNPAIIVPALRVSKAEQSDSFVPNVLGVGARNIPQSVESSTSGSMSAPKSTESQKKGSTVSNEALSTAESTLSVGVQKRSGTGTDVRKGLSASVRGLRLPKTVSSSSVSKEASSVPLINGTGLGSSKAQSSDVPSRSHPAAEVKRELRVLPSRNRKKRRANSKDDSITTVSEALEPVDEIDLLAEVGLSSSNHDPLLLGGSPNGAMMNGNTLSCPSPLVAFPTAESPIPVIQSPAASPSTPSYGTGLSMPSPLSGMSACDVTSPLVIYPMSEPDGTQEPPSPRMSPVNCGQSTQELTLACTPQAGPSSFNASAKQSMDRCDNSSPIEELGYHVGALDTELSQLKDILHSGGLQLDANTLLGLFSNDDSGLHAADSDLLNNTSRNDAIGNELTYYQPDFMDLHDLWNENSRSSPPASPINIQSELNTPIMTPVGAGLGPSSAKKRKL